MPDEHEEIPTATPVLSYRPVQQVALGFIDRRTGLKVWGGLIFALGLLIGCAVTAFVLLASAFAAAPSGAYKFKNTQLAAFFAVLLIQVLAAAALIFIGVASMRIRKYSRPLALTLCVAAMVMTVSGVINSFGATNAMTVTNFNVPPPGTTLPATAPVAPPTVTLVPTAVNSFVWIATLMYLAVALGFQCLVFAFYKSDDTRLTLEQFDPQPRWTDGRPAPVIGMVLICGMIVLWAPITLLFALEMFTQKGPIGPAVLTLMALATGAIALAAIKPIYQMRKLGWQLALLLTAIAAAASVPAIYYSDPASYLAAGGLPDSSLEKVREQLNEGKPWNYASTGTIFLFAFGFLYWARQFFDQDAATQTSRGMLQN